MVKAQGLLCAGQLLSFLLRFWAFLKEYGTLSVRGKFDWLVPDSEEHLHFRMLVPLPGTNSHTSLPDKLLTPQNPGTMWTPLKSIPHCPHSCRELCLNCDHTALWLFCTLHATRFYAPKGRDLMYSFLHPCWEPNISALKTVVDYFLFENWYIWSCCGPSTVASTLITCPQRMKKGVLLIKKKLRTSPNRGSLMKNCQVFIT